MPAAKPPEFRRRAVELARRPEQPIAKIASDLGIAESCLRRWKRQADVDEGHAEGHGLNLACPGPLRDDGVTILPVLSTQRAAAR